MLARIEADFETAGLDQRRLAILRYALVLTRDPASVTEADVAGLRAAGLSDTDILQVAEVTQDTLDASRENSELRHMS